MSTKSTRRTWTKDQKREIATEVRRQRSNGESFRSISRSLEINEGSLRLWMDQFPERALQPVALVDGAIFRSEICLVTPDGFRVEGLHVESVVRLLGQIR